MRVLLAALVAAAVVPAAWGATAPAVRLVRLAPATVAGSGFHARERVVVTASAGTQRLRQAVRTSARGAFLARFTTALHVPPCGRVAVSAVGSRGDRAVWKTPPAECGAPPQPVGQ